MKCSRAKSEMPAEILLRSLTANFAGLASDTRRRTPDDGPDKRRRTMRVSTVAQGFRLRPDSPRCWDFAGQDGGQVSGAGASCERPGSQPPITPYLCPFVRSILLLSSRKIFLRHVAHLLFDIVRLLWGGG